MALTLEAEQRLERVNLTSFYKKSQSKWLKLARSSFKFVRDSFPDGSTIRPDDVAKALLPLLEVNETLADYLNSNKLKQKYWLNDFCDFVLDRNWEKLE